MKKTEQKFITIAGLPRSGSTLLCNILAQNKKIFSTGVTSGIVGLLSNVQENWDKNEAFRTFPDHEAKERVLKGIFHSFYAHVDEPLIIDKNRGWLSQIELLELITGKRPKVIVCVRDMRAVMSSWEKLWRKNKALHALDMPPESRPTVESRVQFWGSSKSHTGRAFLNIQDALHRGFGDAMLFVDFNKLTGNPQNEMDRIYDFIGESAYKHNFNKIEQKNIEADPVGWMQDLHVIRSQVKPVESDWEKVLGGPANGLATSNALWEKLI